MLTTTTRDKLSKASELRRRGWPTTSTRFRRRSRRKFSICLAWMKDNNSCTNGGHVLPAQYANLAALKIQWLNNAKAQLGFEAQVESVQNEPNMRVTYDSCEWTTTEMNTFVANHLQPALAASGLSARIMAPEVSFYSNFDNAWGFPLLNDPGMRGAVSIMATHGYGRTDNFSTPCNSCAQYNKPIWQTEDSNLDGRYNGSIDDGLTWSTEIYKALNGFFRCVYDHRACEISG